MTRASGSLWIVVAPAIVWALHFFAAYSTAAIWCAKSPDSIRPAQIAILAYTALALATLAVLSRSGYARVKREGAPSTTHFLGVSALLLSVLGAIAIVFASMAIVSSGDCR